MLPPRGGGCATLDTVLGSPVDDVHAIVIGSGVAETAVGTAKDERNGDPSGSEQAAEQRDSRRQSRPAGDPGFGKPEPGASMSRWGAFVRDRDRLESESHSGLLAGGPPV